MTGTSKIPMNWRSFLQDDSNKTELFHFLAEKLCKTETTSTVIVTKGEDAISNKKMPLDAVVLFMPGMQYSVVASLSSSKLMIPMW